MSSVNAQIAFLPRDSLDQLVNVLTMQGFQCIGPTVRDNAIIYERIQSACDLPQGYVDQQGPGNYQLRKTNSERCFSFTHGAQGLKPIVFKSRESIWRVDIDDHKQLNFQQTLIDAEQIAVIGVRACDIAALELLDQHFKNPEVNDPYYATRREALFIVAVNCTQSADTCFCVSTGDGPQVQRGYDILLSELDDGYIISANSAKGNAVIKQLPLKTATASQCDKAACEVDLAGKSQQRSVPAKNLRQTLFSNLQHPQWSDVAQRCLSCGSCTMVCPTCFCFSYDHEPSLDGQTAEHFRQWDSCFTQGHSYIHGITIREDTQSRYRQWLTHKFGSWHDQFGRSGCVGCGRCITWCPVGIDVTQELAIIAEPVHA